jgi:Pentapeptide repeats (8 copies)
MSTESKGIVKLDQSASIKKETKASDYLVKNIEVLKSFIFNKTRNFAINRITLVVVTGIIIFLLILGSWTNGLNQQIYYLRELSANAELTADYHRQAVLSDYLNTMASAVLDNNPKPFQEKIAFFRAITQATLQELDAGRKRYVVMFLHDTNLIKISRKQQSILFGANLAGANLQGLNLALTDLDTVNLQGADLRRVNLRGANLKNANLKDSCFNKESLFDNDFNPILLGMKEVKISHLCTQKK